MQVFSRFLDGYANVHQQPWDYLCAKTLAALGEHARRKEALITGQDVVERGRRVREAFLDSIGGLPSSDSPLNARTMGRIERPKYMIEKVIFESEPQVHVSSLLYVPRNLKTPAPAVLFVSGHHRDAKGNPEYQRVCHDLAINGFVVLATDPPGQGERVSHLDPDSGNMAIEWGTTEHTYQGVQCILTGTSIARYFLFDALRGLDYLQSRSEVDRTRIGVTGNSGGGTQTTLLCMSGDERIRAAAPMTYVTSREHYYVTGQPQDAEQLQFAMTRNGINFDDMFLPFAPRPLLIGAVSSDFFNPEGTALTYERLRRMYRLLGYEANVHLEMAPGLHRYCKELRQAVVNWFRKHLLGVAPDFQTQDDEAIETLSESDLWCTSKGHVRTDFRNTRTVFHRNLDQIPQRRAERRPQALRERVMDALCIRERLQSPAPMFPRTVREQEADGLVVKSTFFLSEPGIMVTGGLAYRAGAQPNEAVIYLADGGTARMDDHVRSLRPLLDEGKAAFVFDVRGTGAVEQDPVSARTGTIFPANIFNTDNWLSMCAYCMGDCLLGMRVFDVLRAAAYLRESAGFSRVNIQTEGLQPSLWGYLAAALDPDVQSARITGLIPSFEAIARTELYRTDFLAASIVHGVLKSFDLPDLRVLFDGRRLDIVESSVSLTPSA